MEIKLGQVALTHAKRPYQPARLHVWGEVATVTRAGGSGGSGDVSFNPASSAVGREDGSATLGFSNK